MAFVVIAVAYNVQKITGDMIALREIVIVFFICNEALSILENAAEFIKIPQQLKDALLQLRNKNTEETTKTSKCGLLLYNIRTFDFKKRGKQICLNK